MYPFLVLFGSMASSNDDFRTAICHTQNLSLIKFDYSSIEYFTILLFYNTQAYRSSYRIIKVIVTFMI